MLAPATRAVDWDELEAEARRCRTPDNHLDAVDRHRQEWDPYDDEASMAAALTLLGFDVRQKAEDVTDGDHARLRAARLREAREAVRAGLRAEHLIAGVRARVRLSHGTRLEGDGRERVPCEPIRELGPFVRALLRCGPLVSRDSASVGGYDEWSKHLADLHEREHGTRRGVDLADESNRVGRASPQERERALWFAMLCLDLAGQLAADEGTRQRALARMAALQPRETEDATRVDRLAAQFRQATENLERGAIVLELVAEGVALPEQARRLGVPLRGLRQLVAATRREVEAVA